MARQRTTQTTQESGFVHDNDRQSFSDGTMHVDGVPLMPEEVVHWRSSNGLTTYTTVQWYDAASGVRRTSCNCPGWTVKKAGQHRQCKHTKDMEGVASCGAERVETVRITSAEAAVAAIPDMHEGRALRGFTFGE